MRAPLITPNFLIVSLLATLLVVLWTPAPASPMMTIQEERRLGERLLQEIKRQIPLVEDYEVTQYVRDAGEKILRFIPDPLFQCRFFVIKDDGLNAFAMPGGLVFVYAGLLEEIDSEDELICVLAHELGHVEGRHLARRMERMKRLNLATAAVLIAGAFLGKGKAGSAILATTGALNASIGLKYSREDEEEADRRAFQWICRSGYDPMGLVTVLDKMRRMRWLGTDVIPSYLSTHPGTSERILYIEDLAQTNKCNYTMHRASHELRRIQIRLNVLTRDPFILMKRYQKELNATPGDEYLAYGLALAQLRARNYEEAIKGLKGLIRTFPQHLQYQKDLAWAYYAKGDYKEAIKRLEGYLRLRPQDLSGKYYLGKALLESLRKDEAARLLREVFLAWNKDPRIAFDLGRAMTAINKKGEGHYYFYLYYKDKGEADAAMYHRRMALRLLPKGSPLRQKMGEKKDDKSRNKTSNAVSRSGRGGSGP